MRPTCFISVSVTLTVLLAGCANSQNRESSANQAHSAEQAVTHAELRLTLLELRDRDQDARERVVHAWENVTRNEDGSMMFDEEGTKAMQAMNAIDTESRTFIKRMIIEHGWPSYDMVGEDGANAAWLLAQHADAEPEVQEQVLGLMEPLVDQGQASGARFAMLTDRVLSGRREPQVYGTQFGDDIDGVMRPLPTVDWENVDARRARVGLPPIAEYAASMSETYKQPCETTPFERYPNHPAPVDE